MESGILADVIWCNSMTGTYWIGMNVQGHEGCSPACVVNLETKTAEINWRCTGLITPTPTPETTATPIPSNADLSDATNKFTLDFYSQIKGNPGNLFFSGFSMAEAFGILYEGAKGNTAKEIENVFGFDPNAAKRHDAFKSLNARLVPKNGSYQLNVANALWMQKDFAILPDYKQAAIDYYSSEANNLDFKADAEGSRNTINKWVESKTNEKIKDLLPEGSIHPSTRLVITNAIYFKGAWVEEFDKKLTEDGDFKLDATQTRVVSMMHKTDIFKYMENEKLQMLDMDYKGEDLSMLILLPKGNGISELEKELNPANLAAWKTSLASKDVIVTLPKFKFTKNYNLKGQLKAMGIREAFSETADLSGIDGQKDLFVSDAFHKAFVEVNEEGTEAAAATGIIVGMTSVEMPVRIPDFTADHPFIFLIQDNSNGAILFMGRVSNPLLTE
ncbi:MAG: serpin family protein [Candidatus Micrarchaeota archaeon]